MYLLLLFRLVEHLAMHTPHLITSFRWNAWPDDDDNALVYSSGLEFYLYSHLLRTQRIVICLRVKPPELINQEVLELINWLLLLLLCVSHEEEEEKKESVFVDSQRVPCEEEWLCWWSSRTSSKVWVGGGGWWKIIIITTTTMWSIFHLPHHHHPSVPSLAKCYYETIIITSWPLATSGCFSSLHPKSPRNFI